MGGCYAVWYAVMAFVIGWGVQFGFRLSRCSNLSVPGRGYITRFLPRGLNWCVYRGVGA